MSQQTAARRGARRGGGRKPGYFPRGKGVNHSIKPFKSMILEIAEHTFNTGENKFIPLPTPIDPNVEDKVDLEIIRAEDVKTIAKRGQKL
jgi:hypothetical protein